jgi:hypothetical protein
VLASSQSVWTLHAAPVTWVAELVGKHSSSLPHLAVYSTPHNNPVVGAPLSLCALAQASQHQATLSGKSPRQSLHLQFHPRLYVDITASSCRCRRVKTTSHPRSLLVYLPLPTVHKANFCLLSSLPKGIATFPSLHAFNGSALIASRCLNLPASISSN